MNCILCETISVTVYNGMPFCSKCITEQCSTMRNIEQITTLPATLPIEVLPYLFIGDKQSVVNKDELDKLAITKIIVCGKGLRIPEKMHDGIDYLFLEIDDSLEQNLSFSIKLANNFIGNCNKNVLVHCYSGISRSASIVISHLMKMSNTTYGDAYLYLKQKSSRIQPNSNFEKQLRSINN